MEKTLKQSSSTCLRIVLYGPESTGKTTLAKQLAEHFNTLWVPEYMRTYLQQKWDTSKTVCAVEDLIPIAKGQIDSENEIIAKATNMIFCDTNMLELEVYSKYYYKGFCPPAITEANSTFTYDLYLLTYIDVPWEDDDLRDRPYDRSALFCKFEEELKKRSLPYIVLKGTASNRLQQAIEAMSAYS
jgi:NadR type nicotinamide-nucleotide adenylyltransferase